MKKVVVLGGGTGLSVLLKGLKLFPLETTAIVAVSDDGGSSGKLREEFNIPAIGDIRNVLVSLANEESLIEKLMQYRFKTTSDLNGHPIGNLILASLVDITGNTTDAVKSLSKIMNLNGKILPLTEEVPILVAHTENGEVIEGETKIRERGKKIEKLEYKNVPKVVPQVIKEIENADLVILGIGSLFTSLIPHLLIPEIKEALKNTKAKKMYISNIMTEHGETDGFKVSDCIKAINDYIGENVIDVVVSNKEEIPKNIKERYKKEDNSEPLVIDEEEINKLNLKLIKKDFLKIIKMENKKGEINEIVRHDNLKIAFSIFSYLME